MLLEVSPEYVRRQCRAGVFVTASKRGRTWLVDRAEVTARISARGETKTA